MSQHPGKRRQGKDKLNRILLALFIILVVAGLAVVVYLRFIKQDLPTSKPAQLSSKEVSLSALSADEKSAYDTTSKFLSSIKAGQYKDAYGLMSKELQAEYKEGAGDFEKTVKKANVDQLKEWKISEVTTNSSKDRINVKGSALFATPNQTAKLEFGYYKNADGKYQLYLWQIYPEL